MRRLFAHAAHVALAVALAGCTTPATELIVVVDSPLAVPGELDAVEIVVTGPSGLRTGSTEDLSAPGAPTLPLTLGVSPSGEALGPITVVAIGRRGGEELVRTAARVSLSEGESRLLTLFLVRGCAGRPCAAEETCGAGGCQPLERSDLPTFDGTPPRYVLEDPCDAEPWDADGDGEASVMCGGADCADDDPDRGPGVPEACDGIDNDCDDVIDPGCECAPDGVTESCTSACGSTGIRTCADGTYGECVPPEETCNGADDDCDGRIDEGIEYVARDESGLSGDPAPISAPRIIAAAGGWRVVFADPTVATGDVFLVRRDTIDGAWTAPMNVGSSGTDPELALGEDGMLLIFRRVTPLGSDQAMVRPLMLDGTPIIVARQIEGDTSVPPRFRAVWDGTRYQVGYYDANFLIRPVNPDGSLEPGWTFSSDEDNRADLIYTGGLFAATWARRDNIYFGSADATRVVTQQSIRGADGAQHASLDASGDGFLVAWYDTADSPDGGSSLRALHLDGTTPSDTVVTLSSTLNDPDDLAPPTVRFGGNQFLVTWSDARSGTGDVYFARLSAQGEVLQPATRLSGGDDTAEGETAAAYVDGRFGVVWTRRTGAEGEVRFAEIGCPAPAP